MAPLAVWAPASGRVPTTTARMSWPQASLGNQRAHNHQGAPTATLTGSIMSR